MNIKKFIKRIICLGISSVLITSDSFAEQIITNLSKKPQKQLKNNITKSKLDSLLEKSKNLSSEQKKKILIYASKLSLKAFVTGSTILFINKLLNILFSTKLDEPKNQVKDNTDDPKNKYESDRNIRANYKNKSPFANLEWRNSNCYIDATLQILYEDPEFRKYVEDRANCKENHEEKYVYLSQIFKDMDKSKGETVPYTDDRREFEALLSHNGSACAFVIVFLPLYNLAFNNLFCINDTGSLRYGKMFSADKIDLSSFKKESLNCKSLWFYCEAHCRKDARCELPRTITFENNSIYNLKGVVNYESEHYNAYKSDNNGTWYYIDDFFKKNEICKAIPKFYCCDPNVGGARLVYYQKVK